jgi:hypothetical protein
VSTSQVIDFVNVSLNTDGTLRSGTVGNAQLKPGLFDGLSAEIIADVQPLVDEAQAAANSALGSASTAQSAASTATASAQGAAQAASTATTASNTATTASQSASSSANAASSSATTALNSANHTDLAEAICDDYAVVTQAWAEHMPDTIPPNILAVMGVTGDHWSSRWWANRAAEEAGAALDDLNAALDDALDQVNDAGEYWLGILQDQTEEAIQGIQSLYLGAFVTPPLTDNLGNPIAVGAMYFDISLNAAYVWTGTEWRPLVTPAPTAITKYIYIATAGQTVFTGPDRSGNTLLYDPANLQSINVFKKGLLLTPSNDYTEAVNHITLTAGAAAGDIVQLHVNTVPVVDVAWNTARLDTTNWTSSGGVLKDFQGVTLTPNSVSDLMISADGVWQNPGVAFTLAGSTVTFSPSLAVGFKVFGLAIVPSVTTQVPVPGLKPINTSIWVFDGTATSFPIQDMQGAAVSPVTAVNLLISLNGIWQAAVTDYTVTGSTVTFTTAPEHDALVFAVAGMPALMTTA